MVKTRTVLIVVLLAASFLLFNAAIRKISSRRAAGAASSAPPGRKCPAVKSCEEQREEKCGASPRKGTTTGGRGGTNKAAGRVLVLAVANQGSDTVRVNIFVRSCRTALVRRGSDADIVVLSDSQAAGDRMEIFRIVGVVEAIYDKPEGSGAGSKWAVLRDYLAGASAEGYTSVMIASSEDDMCQLDPFKVIAKGSEGDIHTFEMSPGGDGGTLEKEVTGCFGDKGKFSSSAPISGIVLGGFDAVASYAAKMAELLLPGKAHCSEQAVHNYLVHSGELSKVVSPGAVVYHAEGDAWVRTVKGMKWLNRDYSARVVVSKEDSTVCSVVSKYGASSKLAQQFKKQYPIIPDDSLIGK